MTLAELDQRMGSSELELWKAFYQVEPFGPPRDNHHAAMICAMLANIHRGKNQRPFQNEDFMIVPEELKKARKTNEFVAYLSAVAKPKNG